MPAEGLLQDGIGESGLALLLAAQPVDLTLVRREIIDCSLQRHELTQGLGVKGAFEERDVERLRGIEIGRWESLMGSDAGQLRLGPDERGDLIAKRPLQRRRDSSLQCGRVERRRLEHDIPAGDEGLDVREAERLEDLAQAVHLDGVPADVNGSQEGDVSRYGC